MAYWARRGKFKVCMASPGRVGQPNGWFFACIHSKKFLDSDKDVLLYSKYLVDQHRFLETPRGSAIGLLRNASRVSGRTTPSSYHVNPNLTRYQLDWFRTLRP